MPHQLRVVRLASIALVVAGLRASVPAAAQGTAPSSPTLSPGSRVRLHLEVPPETPLGLGEPRVVGTLVRVGEDALVVRHGEDTVAYARSRVRRFEVSQGRTTRGRVVARSALTGAVVGVLAGATLGATSYSCREDELCFSTRSEATGLGGLVFGVGGLVIGTLVGSRRSLDRWRRVPLAPDLRIGAIAAPGGVGVTIGL